MCFSRGALPQILWLKTRVPQILWIEALDHHQLALVSVLGSIFLMSSPRSMRMSRISL